MCYCSFSLFSGFAVTTQFATAENYWNTIYLSVNAVFLLHLYVSMFNDLISKVCTSSSARKGNSLLKESCFRPHTFLRFNNFPELWIWQSMYLCKYQVSIVDCWCSISNIKYSTNKVTRRSTRNPKSQTNSSQPTFFILKILSAQTDASPHMHIK